MTIKSLLVKIGADISEFEAGLNKAQGYLEDHAKEFRKVGTAVTVAGAAITGTIGSMVLSYTQAGDALLEMSQRTGMSTTALSELKFAASLCGTDIDTVELAIKKMAMTLVDAATKGGAAADSFTAIGLNVQNLINLSPEQQFDKISRAIAAVENPTIRAAAAQDIFGRSGTKLLPMLSGGTAGLDAMKQKAHDLGVVFSTEAAAKADALGDSVTILKASFAGIGNAVATTLVPIITNLATTISNIIVKVKGWMDAHPGLTSALVTVGAVVGVLATVLGPIIIMLPLLASGFAMLTGPIGIAVGAIMGIIAVGTLLVAHWDDIKKLIGDCWDAIKTKTVEVWNSIRDFFVDIWTKIKTIFSTAWDAIKTGIGNAFEFIKNLVTGSWNAIVSIFTEFKNLLIGIVTALVEAIKEKFLWLFNKVKEIVTSIKDHTIGLFKNIWEKVAGHSIVPELVASVIADFLAMKTGVGSLMTQMATQTKTIFTQIKTNTGTLINDTTAAAQAGFFNIKDYAQAMGSETSESFSSMGDALKSAARSMIKTLENQAIAFAIAKIMAQYPFPVNLALTAVAIAAIKLLFNAIKFGEGGVVTRPTLAMIGERGPEAVIPLDRAAGFGMGGAFALRQNNYFYGNISSNLDIDEISRRLAERTMQAVSKGRRGY